MIAVERFQDIGHGKLPGLLGMEVLAVESGRCRIRLPVSERVHAPNGYLHGGAVVALADTACGYGCVASLPEGATGFATIELNVNFVGTLLEGAIVAEARLTHGGRTTQVWEASVSDETTGRPIAIFRCTQMVLRRP